MKTKLVTSIVTLLLVSIFLVGCTTPAATPTGTPTPTIAPTETPTPKPTEAPETDTNKEPSPLSLNLEDVYQACMAYQTANSGTEAPFMFPSDFSDPYWDDAYPGLSSVALKQTVLYVPPIVTFACEVVLVEVANEADIATVHEIFEKRIAYGANNSSCDPETALLWQTNARIYQEGNYIGMIVLPSEYLIFETIFTEIK